MHDAWIFDTYIVACHDFVYIILTNTVTIICAFTTFIF